MIDLSDLSSEEEIEVCLWGNCMKISDIYENWDYEGTYMFKVKILDNPQC